MARERVGWRDLCDDGLDLHHSGGYTELRS